MKVIFHLKFVLINLISVNKWDLIIQCYQVLNAAKSKAEVQF